MVDGVEVKTSFLRVVFIDSGGQAASSAHGGLPVLKQTGNGKCGIAE